MLAECVVFVACSISATLSVYSAPKCPVQCVCEHPRIKCEGGIIPSLDTRLTSLQIHDATPAIISLTPDITKKLHHLEDLQLHGVGLREIKAGALQVITNLHNLKITNNNISKIGAATFINCSRMTYLNLENNNISVIEDKTFAALSNLRNLSIAHNALLSLPKYLPAKLQVLNTEYNQITEVQNLSLSNLTSLNLCYNAISYIDPHQIDVRNVREMCIGGAGFKLSDSLIKHHTFPVLESLHIKGTSRSPVMIKDNILNDIKAMAEISLHTLELVSCRLTSAKFFNHTKSKIHTLRASDIVLKTRSAITKFTLPSITMFDLSGSPVLAKLFLTTPAPTTLPDLKSLRLSHCNIKTFPESFLQYKTPNITHLDLSHNPLECTCGLSWIPNYVRQGKLILLQEENTTCATPDYLKGIPLLTASLCPVTNAISSTTKSSINATTLATTTFNTTLTTATRLPTQTTSSQNLGNSTKRTEISTVPKLPSPPHSSNKSAQSLSTSQDEQPSYASVITAGVVGVTALIIFVIVLVGLVLRCRSKKIFSVPENSNTVKG